MCEDNSRAERAFFGTLVHFLVLFASFVALLFVSNDPNDVVYAVNGIASGISAGGGDVSGTVTSGVGIEKGKDGLPGTIAVEQQQQSRQGREQYLTALQNGSRVGVDWNGFATPQRMEIPDDHIHRNVNAGSIDELMNVDIDVDVNDNLQLVSTHPTQSIRLDTELKHLSTTIRVPISHKNNRRSSKYHRTIYQPLHGPFGSILSPSFKRVPLPSMFRMPVLESNRMHFFLFSANIFMLFWCYWATVLTHPGGVSDWWNERPDMIVKVMDPNEPSADIESGLLPGTPQQSQPYPSPSNMPKCSVCNAVKPPRVHHCKFCKTCVLRMDHHCVYTMSCIGFRNNKAFILFLMYTFMACAYAILIYARFFIHLTVIEPSDLVSTFRHDRLPIFMVLVTVALIICIASFLGTLTLFGWQVYIMTRNMSSVEYHKILTGTQRSNPYNKGWYNNCRHLMGHRPYLWLFPIRDRAYKMRSKGLS